MHKETAGAEPAKKTKRDLNRVVNKHMKKALANIDVKDLTVEKIREDILQMTDLENIVEATLGRAIDAGEQISYGELLALAGRVGGHGQLADLFSKEGLQGIKTLNEDGTGIWHRRYYLDGTHMAELHDSGTATAPYLPDS